MTEVFKEVEWTYAASNDWLHITYDVVKHTGSFPTNLDDYRVIVDMRSLLVLIVVRVRMVLRLLLGCRHPIEFS